MKKSILLHGKLFGLLTLSWAGTAFAQHSQPHSSETLLPRALLKVCGSPCPEVCNKKTAALRIQQCKNAGIISNSPYWNVIAVTKDGTQHLWSAKTNKVVKVKPKPSGEICVLPNKNKSISTNELLQSNMVKALESIIMS